MSSPLIQSLITHVALVIDESSSIAQLGLTSTVVKVVDAQIAYLAQRSRELDQEVRVSVYTFADTPRCLVWDKDVLRLPSIKDHYKPYGNTALIEGSLMAISDLKEIPQRHGSHAYLIYAVSDGRNNRGLHLTSKLTEEIKGLPEHWTFAALVPDQTAVFEAKSCGIPAGNIAVWSTTTAGGENVGDVMRQSADNFLRARATGAKGTKNLFSMNVAGVSTTAVKQNLTELKPADYMVLPVSRKVAIKPFVESWTKEPMRIGSAYFPLTKPEKVQAHKQICIQHKVNGKVYAGSAARQMLGLPDHEVKVEPATHPEWLLYIQSQSVNRWLVPGTNLLVMK